MKKYFLLILLGFFLIGCSPDKEKIKKTIQQDLQNQYGYNVWIKDFTLTKVRKTALQEQDIINDMEMEDYLEDKCQYLTSVVIPELKAKGNIRYFNTEEYEYRRMGLGPDKPCHAELYDAYKKREILEDQKWALYREINEKLKSYKSSFFSIGYETYIPFTYEEDDKLKEGLMYYVIGFNSKDIIFRLNISEDHPYSKNAHDWIINFYKQQENQNKTETDNSTN